jgi:hypothetical protein
MIPYIHKYSLIYKRFIFRYFQIGKTLYIPLFSFLLLLNGCVVKYTPVIDEEKQLLVVQGLITNQPEADTIKLSKSLPMGQISDAITVSGCDVRISDDIGNVYRLTESKPGTYITNPSDFKGEIGRFYKLHITTVSNNSDFNFQLNYESAPMEMKPVPRLDSLYYVKLVIEPPYKDFKGEDACQIYLNTSDPENTCKFYRWDFSETWVLRLLFPVENQTCWITENSHDIVIKSTASFTDSRIDRFPIKYISNITDRLKTKYSILVNQYSMNEDEFNYWEKLQNVTAQVGGLYDIIPASIPSNIICIEKPDEKVLGYFSVSAKSSKRIFIKDKFEGIIDRYNKCIKDTIPYIDPPGLGVTVWILDDEPYHIGPFKVTTADKGCADCTVRGTTKEPDFWINEK